MHLTPAKGKESSDSSMKYVTFYKEPDELIQKKERILLTLLKQSR